MKLQYILILVSIIFYFAPHEADAQEKPDRFPTLGEREENYSLSITAKVVDEDNGPLTNFPIHIKIENVNDYKDGYNDFIGRTNHLGEYSVKGVGRPVAKVYAVEDGYYPSEKTIVFNDGNVEQIRKSGKYQPWNPTVVIMVKKIGKPIPMLVRRGSRMRSWIKPKEKELSARLEWDLVKGDWIKPHGMGEVGDIILQFESKYENELNNYSKVKLKLGNKNDGFIVIDKFLGEESKLKFPKNAPRNGYNVNNLVIKSDITENILSELPKHKPKGYLVRLRTKKDKDGKIISAIYGKITSPLKLYRPNEGYKYPILTFEYYLNMNRNDTNIEYDGINNLAPEADPGLVWPP